MPVHFIDNYPKNDLESQICRQDKSPLYGELWVYQEFLKFNENGFLPNETWYIKHNYNLSSHPSSYGKVEGQLDFLLITQYGVLIIEVKGGGIEVDQDDVYYSYDKKNHEKRYEAQNPFNQVKEYVHSLRSLIDSKPFIYRAVIFPHEAKFEIKGPQLCGYKYLFFSKTNLDQKDSDYGKNLLFFNFLLTLAKESRKNIIEQLNSTVTRGKLEERIWKQFPLLTKREIDRLRTELFPTQTTYGFNPDRIKNELILAENFEILQGLRKNRKVMIQGGPGTGKTVLATKFLAQNLLKQRKGIYFCANKLLRAKMEYLICVEYNLDPNLISFRVYTPNLQMESLELDIDFLIIDEAQEFFDKGLDDFIKDLESMIQSPQFLVLYDSEQAIAQNFKDIDWYADFLMQTNFVHYLFDTVWRCTQNKQVLILCQLLKNGQYKKILKDFKSQFIAVNNVIEKIRAIKAVVESTQTNSSKCIILINSKLFENFKEFANDYFKKELEELTPVNVNVKSGTVHFTTPIMYRGLEADNVVLITSALNDGTRIQNYIGASRAVYTLKCILWS